MGEGGLLTVICDLERTMYSCWIMLGNSRGFFHHLCFYVFTWQQMKHLRVKHDKGHCWETVWIGQNVIIEICRKVVCICYQLS